MKRILVGLDASPRARDVLDAAIDLARRTGAKLRLFRSVGLPPELPASLWSLPPAQVTETFLAAASSPSRAAREHDVDLIVIGSHGYGILDRLIGTTAAKVVNHADRSVLVVRPPPDAGVRDV